MDILKNPGAYTSAFSRKGHEKKEGDPTEKKRAGAR